MNKKFNPTNQKRRDAAAMLTDVLISPDHLSRVFHLHTNKGSGTCFFHECSKGHFFVTAAHLVSNVKPGELLYFGKGNDRIGFPVLSINLHPDGYDVAAFSLNVELGASKPIDLETPYYLPGQVVKFAGFPHGLMGQFPTYHGFSCPLVRGAFISGSLQIAGRETLLLDGFNNPGYSGSPIWVSGENGQPSLIGMIFGFRYEQTALGRVYRTELDGSITPIENMHVNQNSGLIYCAHLKSIGDVAMGLEHYQPYREWAEKVNYGLHSSPPFGTLTPFKL